MTLRLQPATPTAHEVFDILARQHADMLTTFLRGLVHQHEVVDDLFQETMIVAWRRLADYDRSLPFGPWLRGIASKLVLEHRRKSARAFLSCEPEVLEGLEAEFRRFEREPADSFRHRLDRLVGCLDRLPPMMREALDMAYGRGLSLSALAAAVESTEEAIKKRVQRARQLLGNCIQGDAP
ncbi:MAG: sigma-70 family RNA polymerase sigma factor [Phycisphaerales bacterium]